MNKPRIAVAIILAELIIIALVGVIVYIVSTIKFIGCVL